MSLASFFWLLLLAIMFFLFLIHESYTANYHINLTNQYRLILKH